jgi:hypothetical protein
MTQTLSERFVGQLNANVFFAEFAFASSQLRVPEVGEVELADHLVLFDDVGLIFQLKERSADVKDDSASLSSWFVRKVRKAAVSQIAKTKAMMRQFAGTRIRNQRGHQVHLPDAPPTRLSSIVIYHASSTTEFYAPKYCISRSAGFVHFIAAKDYFGVCQSLVTPAEVLEYLAFREDVVKLLNLAPAQVSEAALVGQFMGGTITIKAIPHERYANILDALIQDREQWDISYLTDHLGEQIKYRDGDASATQYYRILAQLAKLSRAELRELKILLGHATEAVRTDTLELPYRFALPRNDCGFLLLAVPSNMHPKAHQTLMNVSLLSKYELKVSKHVSLSMRRVKSFLDIEWMYAEGPVKANEKLDAFLARNYPFRKLREDLRTRYQFNNDDLRDLLSEQV